MKASRSPLKSLSLLAAASFLTGQVGNGEAVDCCDTSSHGQARGQASGANSSGTNCLLTLPVGLPDSFDLRLKYRGKLLTLELEKSSVFGSNTRFLVSDGSGALTRVDPGLDRAYLGQVAEHPSFVVSAVLNEEGLMANIIRPGFAPIRVEPVEGTADRSQHRIMLGEGLDHQTLQFGAPSAAADSSVDQGGAQTAASMAPITTIFSLGGSAQSSNAGSTATLPPSRVMDVLEFEIGIEIGSNAFLSSSAYNSNLSRAQATAQALIGNLDARYLRAAGVKHRLGTVIIRTDAASDPLRGSVTSNSSASLSAFRNYWNSHPGEVGNSHDLAVYHVKYPPSGRAYVNSVGTSNRYALSCGNGATSWADGTIVHEFGHSWNLRHTADNPISEYSFGATLPSSFYESKPRSNSGVQVQGGSHVFVSVMHGSGAHNIGRLATDEANTVYEVRQQKRNHGDVLTDPGQIPPFARRDHAMVVGGQPVIIDVIANDYDANNDVLDAELLDTVSHNGAVISLSVGTGPGGRNRLIYTPPVDPPGNVDFFHYQVCDTSGRTDWGAVYVVDNDRVAVDLTRNKYDYDMGPAASPVQAGWTAITPGSYGDISWSGAKLSAVDRDPGNTNNINRDLVYGSGVSTLNHKLANGIWSITMNMGDSGFPHDLMGVRAEGVTIRSGLTAEAGEFPYASGQVLVSDGELNLEFFDGGGSDPNWVLTRLSLTKVGDFVSVDTSARSYDYDLGPVGSPVRLGWSGISPGTGGDIFWSGAAVKAVDRDPGTTNEINRDLVYGSGISRLNHKIANGVWSLTMNLGDASSARDLMGVRAEGVAIKSGLNSAVGEFPYATGEVTVVDGELNLEFFDEGGSDASWSVTRISLSKVRDFIVVDPSLSSYKYDLGPTGSPVQSGWLAITPEIGGDVNWSGSPVNGEDRDPGGGVNSINRDFIFGSGTSQLNHKLADGIWRVVFNMGDSSHAHDLMGVRAEGRLVSDNITSPAGQFSYVDEDGGSSSPTGFEVAVTDGELNLEFFDNGGADPDWVITRMSLTRVAELDPPVADGRSVTANSGIPLAIKLTGSDPNGDSLGFRVGSPPAHGSLSGVPPNLVYTAVLNYEGTDEFTFIARDEYLDSEPATVTIVVNNPDTDGDGLSDGFEYVYYGHHTSASDGTGDLDQDGVSDADEVEAGTDASDSASLFRLVDEEGIQFKKEGDESVVTLKWHSQMGRTYTIWRSGRLDGRWIVEATNVPAQVGGVTKRQVGCSEDRCFFRVGIDPEAGS